MRRIPILVFVLVAASTYARAGEIFGKILDGASSVGDRATVAMKCGERVYPAQKTDPSGSFHVVVAETGKCTLTVTYDGRSADLALASYDEAVQVDLVLETRDGKLSVRRK